MCQVKTSLFCNSFYNKEVVGALGLWPPPMRKSQFKIPQLKFLFTFFFSVWPIRVFFVFAGFFKTFTNVLSGYFYVSLNLVPYPSG